MKVFAISEDVLQAVGDYLVRQPYAEVARLVSALQALRPVESMTASEDKAVPTVEKS